jgi:glucose/mannose-6-phosphate isomerase
LKEAVQIALSAKIEKREVDSVLISGLGGSGIGGSMAFDLFSQECKVPIAVNKDYFIPAFVNSKTLVIISSYSGNTEETVSAYHQAKKKGACIVVVSSGGQILADAVQSQIMNVQLPGGNPPRTCLGYSFVQIVSILEKFELIVSGSTLQMNSISDFLKNEKDEIFQESFGVANKIANKIPVIYGSNLTESIALRFRQQLNENSKILCWHHVFPEMNHNELVGWTKENNDLAVLILRTDFDNPRVNRRMEICKDIFKKYTHNLLEIHAKGDRFITQAFYLIHFTDWVSWHLAELNQVDAIEVNVIDFLKNELSKS